jgi:hypothetical protein
VAGGPPQRAPPATIPALHWPWPRQVGRRAAPATAVVRWVLTPGLRDA